MSTPNASQPFMGQPSVDDYVKKVMGNVRACQKLSADLQGLHHYRDYPGVETAITKVTTSVTSLIRNVFGHQDIDIRLPLQGVTDQFDMIREGNDALLERINSDVDEAAGVKKNPDAEMLDNTVRRIHAPVSNTQDMVLLASRNIEKPQQFFSQKINNSHKEPFIPLIKDKPHNIKPLSILLCVDDTGNDYYSHPYLYELQSWGPPESQLCEVRPTRPLPVDETPLILVDREEDLYNMLEALKNCTAFAVDLEHHSFRSYQGLACLMQISTLTQDFIVDPFALRGKLTCLNEVFADPKITKVFHGADYDILWLQRDFGIYVVNMFDTHQAAVVLEYPQRSLAALLDKFTHVTADKTYQRADWRIRPLPQDFISYARQDSHYLLFIYDLMRNELISKGNNLNNLLNAVYCRSTDICMKRYEKPIVTPESHLDLYRRSRKFLNSRQMYGLQQIYLWRDKIAREQDESVEYVLPKHMMLNMSEVLPKEMQGVLACCNPIPPLVKTELLSLHNIMRAAREQKLDVVETATIEQAVAVAASGQTASNDMAEVMISKHDLCNLEDSKELPTLLKPQETLLGDLFSQHKVQIHLQNTSKLFGVRKDKLQIDRRELFKKTNDYMGGYERYKLYLELKPLIEDEKKKGKSTKKETLERVNKVRDHFLSLTNNTRRQTPLPSKKTNTVETDTSLRVANEDILDFSGDGRKLQKEQQHMDDSTEERQPLYERGYMDPNDESPDEDGDNAEKKQFSIDTEGSKHDYVQAEIGARRRARENPWAKYVKNHHDGQSQNDVQMVENPNQRSQKGGSTPALEDYMASLKPNIDGLLKQMRTGVEQGMGIKQSSKGGSIDGLLQQMRSASGQKDESIESGQGMGPKQSSTGSIDGLLQQMRSASGQNNASIESSSEEEIEEITEKQPTNNSKKNKQRRGDRKGPMVLKAEIKKKNQQKKRHSDEGNNDTTIKKAKIEEAKVENENKNTGSYNESNSNSSSDNDQNENQTADQNENQSADQNESQTADQNKEVFDYGKADYSMFERKKNKKKHGHQIKEKFKGKNQKSNVHKKSGLKSFTWGNKGAGGAGGKW